MTNALRAAYRFWAALLFLAVLVQIGAAGYGAFHADHGATDAHPLSHKSFDHGFNFHSDFGYIIFIGSLILLLFALGARLDRRGVLRSLALAVLVFLTIVLARGGESHPVIGIFHPIVAFLVAGLSGFLAHSAWSRRSAG